MTREPPYPEFTYGQGYVPSAKDERRAGFENGVIVGFVAASLVITGLIALFSYALGV